MSLLVILTVYKREHLEKQLRAISCQTKKPDYLVVFQNENHMNIDHLKDTYQFLHVKNDFNTKFFGRFAYCLNFDVEYCIVLDDDIIPGARCLETYLNQCISKNAIIGGNGRYCFDNPLYKSRVMRDVGIRDSVEVDYVGHLWCFKKDWLYYMFGTKPFTYDTGEDMHLCFTSKVFGNIKCYVAKQSATDEDCDTTGNRLADDAVSSFKTSSHNLRKDIQNYFIKEHNLQFVI